MPFLHRQNDAWMQYLLFLVKIANSDQIASRIQHSNTGSIGPGSLPCSDILAVSRPALFVSC